MKPLSSFMGTLPYGHSDVSGASRNWTYIDNIRKGTQPIVSMIPLGYNGGFTAQQYAQAFGKSITSMPTLFIQNTISTYVEPYINKQNIENIGRQAVSSVTKLFNKIGV